MLSKTTKPPFPPPTLSPIRYQDASLFLWNFLWLTKNNEWRTDRHLTESLIIALYNHKSRHSQLKLPPTREGRFWGPAD